ncbi:SDR family NAD(P)-dependent oxidoreductase [Carnobacterium gallinarum]|uniref:SDR family NAD(P)-dependent oxidoreductase n=1 Tax=Carnobacterium gallinarum TaxID=2749 RepID=UPI00054D0D64|nr:SDR family NAD(P)-dependent oxidoreductase [Carnobacterium gallinarum]
MKKYVLITGASSGIGKSAAEAFAKRGKHLILVARREQLLKEAKIEIQERYPHVAIILIPMDLGDPAALVPFYHSLKSYSIECFINNAGLGMYGEVATQDIQRIQDVLNLNTHALTILSTLYAHDYHDVEGSQLINISSAGGYVMVPDAVIYCATKFFVNAFTENLAKELIFNHSKLRAKVLAPAATKTEFGMRANQVEDYQYDTAFSRYHTSTEMADFLLSLYDSHAIIGSIDRETFTFQLSDNQFPDAYQSKNNQ